MSKTPKVIAILLYIAGVIMMVAGAGTWVTVSNQLAAERITVTDDAPCQAGQDVNGPLEAFCMAAIIKTHTDESTGGKTYAELDREDPLRAVAMNSSFLRASLFTSVVAFGVAAFAFGVGLLVFLIALAISALHKNDLVDAPAEPVLARS